MNHPEETPASEGKHLHPLELVHAIISAVQYLCLLNSIIKESENELILKWQPPTCHPATHLSHLLPQIPRAKNVALFRCNRASLLSTWTLKRHHLPCIPGKVRQGCAAAFIKLACLTFKKNNTSATTLPSLFWWFLMRCIWHTLLPLTF